MAEQTNNRRRKTAQPLDPTLGHLQPQALEIEKAVLGALTRWFIPPYAT